VYIYIYKYLEKLTLILNSAADKLAIAAVEARRPALRDRPCEIAPRRGHCARYHSCRERERDKGRRERERERGGDRGEGGGGGGRETERDRERQRETETERERERDRE
jgi:hypothetical protein